MDKSASIENLAKAMIAAQAEFPDVPKTKEVIVQTQKGSYVFKYAPLERMLPLLRPVLTKHGLGFTQGADGDKLVTTIFHISGEWLSHSMPLMDTASPQQYGAQFTYRRRYSLKAALGIETDDDDADNQFTDDGKKRKITPNAGAMDNVNPKRHEAIHRMAGSIVDCFNAGRPDEAYKAYKEVTENEEKLAVWSFLDSKMRRQLKKFDEEKGAH